MQLVGRAVQRPIFALIDPTNEPSQRVAQKLGFRLWKLAEVDGLITEVHHRRTFAPLAGPVDNSGGASEPCGSMPAPGRRREEAS